MNNKKILVVENENIASFEIKKSLTKYGFNKIQKAYCSDDALEKIHACIPDLIIMDINLNEKIDGIQLIQQIKKNFNIPVLYLSAFSDEKTRQRAFKTDPIGYLTKPFNGNELNITVKLALYKIENFNVPSINENYTSLGFDYHFDYVHKKFYYKNKTIKLSPKEKKLLILLHNANFSYVSCQIIEHDLWPESTPSHSSLRTLVYRLKTKLACKIIETSYNEGYKLIKEN